MVALIGGFLFAGDAVSPAFTFDSRYERSGASPDAWAAYQAEGLSARFTAATVVKAVDANGNGIPDTWEALYGLAGGDAAATADPDGDGRTNLQEYNAGTNPILAENYAAGMSFSAAWTVDTWIPSTASDGGELTEVRAFSGIFTTDTAGRAPDSDKDGMPDWFETLYGLNPNQDDALLDPDGDGRTNLQEYNAGTNPILADDWTRSIAETAEAFETDTRVFYTGGNPTFDDTFAVVKVSNSFICDTGGLYYDWDGDGIPNWWEARFSRDGSKTGLNASVDDDGDGIPNYNEFVAYTDPTDSVSKFVIGIELIEVVPLKSRFKLASLPQSGASSFALRWQSARDRIYSVYMRESLTTGDWVKVAEIVGTGDQVEYLPAQLKASMFFKVSVRLADDR